MKKLFVLAALLFATQSIHATEAPPAAPIVAPAAPAEPSAPAPAAPADAVVPKKEDEIPAEPVANATAPRHPSLADRVKAFMGNSDAPALHAKISALTLERATAQTQHATLTAQLATLTRERDDARAELATVEAALEGKASLVKATAAEIAQTVGMPMASLPAPLSEQQTATVAELAHAVRTAPDAASRLKAHAAWVAASK